MAKAYLYNDTDFSIRVWPNIKDSTVDEVIYLTNYCLDAICGNEDSDEGPDDYIPIHINIVTTQLTDTNVETDGRSIEVNVGAFCDPEVLTRQFISSMCELMGYLHAEYPDILNSLKLDPTPILNSYSRIMK